ncbi:MAG: hypothetical protein IT580_22805 [Verrucomicrobiales bacterium]|nr:hypothetical protein [Verrucomicrobiales bacterium]
MNTRLFLESLVGMAVLALAARGAVGAEPEGTRLAAQLLWGTNGEKPAGKELKPVEGELDRRLRRVFKWKSYFEIERKAFATPVGKPTKVDMSKECRLEVLNVSGDEFEIQLFGKGVLVVKKRQRIVAGETVVLGGDDKNDNAWFVVLGMAKPGDPARP